MVSINPSAGLIMVDGWGRAIRYDERYHHAAMDELGTTPPETYSPGSRGYTCEGLQVYLIGKFMEELLQWLNPESHGCNFHTVIERVMKHALFSNPEARIPLNRLVGEVCALKTQFTTWKVITERSGMYVSLFPFKTLDNMC